MPENEIYSLMLPVFNYVKNSVYYLSEGEKYIVSIWLIQGNSLDWVLRCVVFCFLGKKRLKMN